MFHTPEESSWREIDQAGLEGLCPPAACQAGRPAGAEIPEAAFRSRGGGDDGVPRRRREQSPDSGARGGKDAAAAVAAAAEASTSARTELWNRHRGDL